MPLLCRFLPLMRSYEDKKLILGRNMLIGVLSFTVSFSSLSITALKNCVLSLQTDLVSSKSVRAQTPEIIITTITSSSSQNLKGTLLLLKSVKLFTGNALWFYIGVQYTTEKHFSQSGRIHSADYFERVSFAPLGLCRHTTINPAKGLPHDC